MLKQILILLVALVAIRLVFRLLVRLHLLPLLIYSVLVKTVLSDWAVLHPYISIGIFVTIALLVVLTWIQPLIQRRREEQIATSMLLDSFDMVHKMGLSDDQYSITMQGGIPVIRYK